MGIHVTWVDERGISRSLFSDMPTLDRAVYVCGIHSYDLVATMREINTLRAHGYITSGVAQECLYFLSVVKSDIGNIFDSHLIPDILGNAHVDGTPGHPIPFYLWLSHYGTHAELVDWGEDWNESMENNVIDLLASECETTVDMNGSDTIPTTESEAQRIQEVVNLLANNMNLPDDFSFSTIGSNESF
jgi:hypothetical protein